MQSGRAGAGAGPCERGAAEEAAQQANRDPERSLRPGHETVPFAQGISRSIWMVPHSVGHADVQSKGMIEARCAASDGSRTSVVAIAHYPGTKETRRRPSTVAANGPLACCHASLPPSRLRLRPPCR